MLHPQRVSRSVVLDAWDPYFRGVEGSKKNGPYKSLKRNNPRGLVHRSNQGFARMLLDDS